MNEQSVIPVEELIQEPYASVLCFPTHTEAEIRLRIDELKNHNITGLEFAGKASLFRIPLPVVGKGFVGIVVIAHMAKSKIAVKIRRMDADRADLLKEGIMLEKANSVNVGPKMIAASKNFLLMQLIEGDVFPNWLKTNKETSTVKHVLEDLLEQCYRLDQYGLDHGELSKAPKHLLVDNSLKPFIVDFETSSVNRRPANVTAICQYLFAGNSSASKMINPILRERTSQELIDVLRNYKNERNRINFEAIKRVFLQQN